MNFHSRTAHKEIKDKSTIQTMSPPSPAHRGATEPNCLLLRSSENSGCFTIPNPGEAPWFNEPNAATSSLQISEVGERTNSVLSANLAKRTQKSNGAKEQNPCPGTATKRFKNAYEDENAEYNFEFYPWSSQYDLDTSKCEQGFIFPEQRHFEIDTFVSSPILQLSPADEELGLLYLT